MYILYIISTSVNQIQIMELTTEDNKAPHLKPNEICKGGFDCNNPNKQLFQTQRCPCHAKEPVEDEKEVDGRGFYCLDCHDHCPWCK